MTPPRFHAETAEIPRITRPRIKQLSMSTGITWAANAKLDMSKLKDLVLW